MVVRKTFFSIEEMKFLSAIFVSVCGDVLIPTAFALESLRVDAAGTGFTIVLLVLWGARFSGTLLYRNFPSIDLKFAMIGADLIRLIAQVGLCIWIFLYTDSIIAMSISSLIYGMAAAFFIPSRFALTPEIVSTKNLQRFNSVVNLMTDTLMILSPAIATAIFIWFGFIPILIFDAVTFFLGILLLSLITVDQKKENFINSKENDSQNHSLNDLRKLPMWSSLGILTWGFITLVIGYSGTAGPSFIINHFNPTGWAIVSTALAVSSILGSAGHLIGAFQKISWNVLQMLAGFLISVQIILFAFSPSLVLVAVIAFSASLIMSSAGIAWDTKNQQTLDTHQLRVFANWESFFTSGTVPAGMALFGLGTLIGAEKGMTVAIALLCVVSIVPFFVVSKREYFR